MAIQQKKETPEQEVVTQSSISYRLSDITTKDKNIPSQAQTENSTVTKEMIKTLLVSVVILLVLGTLFISFKR